MRNKLFLIIKLLSQFRNKLMISLYTTMFYNNVVISQGFILAKNKAFKIKQRKWEYQADRANY